MHILPYDILLQVAERASVTSLLNLRAVRLRVFTLGVASTNSLR